MILPAEIGVVLVASMLVMAVVWEVQRRTRNTGFVDVAWSALMGAAAVWYSATGDGALVPRLMVALLGGLWGMRLALHLLARVLKEPEDGRYRYLRQHWNDSQPKQFLFFQFQALLVVLFSLPFWAAAGNPVDGFTPWVWAAIAVWLLSQLGEGIADRQLDAFRSNPANRGKTCRYGLWRYSRHPNYFFEWTQWFAYLLLAVGAPFWWLALAGPVLMLVSLCWVTGIPFTEAQALRSRGEDYRRYQRETSVFVPWFPRQPVSHGKAGAGGKAA
jgi:steroid 5-alpha reductase family enzyme